MSVRGKVGSHLREWTHPFLQGWNNSSAIPGQVGGGTPAKNRINQTIDENDIVEACARVRREGMLLAHPYVITKRGTRVDNHPIIEQLYALMLGALYDAAYLTGDGILAIGRNSVGIPEDLCYISYHSLRIRRHRVTNGTTTVFTTVYEERSMDPGASQLKYYTEDEVFHLRWQIHPKAPWRGRSPLETVVGSVRTDAVAETYIGSMLYNSGVPGLIIMPGKDDKQNISEELAHKIKEQFDSGFNAARAGKTAVMGERYEVTEIRGAAQRLNLSDIRHVPEERICAVSGVHPALANLGTGIEGTRVNATLRTVFEHFVTTTAETLLNIVEDEINLQLMPLYGIPGIFRFDRRQLPGKQERMMNLYTNAAATQTELRASHGLDPLAPEEHAGPPVEQESEDPKEEELVRT